MITEVIVIFQYTNISESSLFQPAHLGSSWIWWWVCIDYVARSQMYSQRVTFAIIIIVNFLWLNSLKNYTVYVGDHKWLCLLTGNWRGSWYIMEEYGGSTWGRLLSLLTPLLCHCYQRHDCGSYKIFQYMLKKMYHVVFVCLFSGCHAHYQLWILWIEFIQLCECVYILRRRSLY